MQLNRIGNIEQENTAIDLDQIEREMESQLEDEAVDVQPELPPASNSAKPVTQAPPTVATNNAFVMTNTRGKGASKFMPQAQMQVRSSFWPGQTTLNTTRSEIAEQKRDLFFAPLLVKPVTQLDSKFDPRLRQKPANDAKAKTDTTDTAKQDQNAPKSSRSRFARATVEALLSIGALPMAMLVEIGRFRAAKENRLLSLARQAQQGNEDAERSGASAPALKKKDFIPPAPTGPQ